MKKLYVRLVLYFVILASVLSVVYINIDPLMFMLVKSKNNLIPKIFLYLGKDPDLQNSQGASLLSQACYSNNIEMVEFLLDKGAGIDSLVADGITPISVAAQMKNYDIVKLLTEKGADLNKKLGKKETCLLSVVIMHGNLEVVKYLVKKGADVNQYNKKCFSPVGIASYNDKEEILQYLLENGGRKRDIRRKAPPFINAASEGDDLLVDRYIKGGADVNAINSKGQSALFLAIGNKKESTVKILLSSGADVNLQDRDGITPLMKACEEKAVEIVKQLINAGADVNLKTNTGKTALMYAAQKNLTDIVKYLKFEGADINAVTKAGRSAYTYMRNDSIDIKELLRDKNNIIIFNEDVFSNENEDIKYDWLYPNPSGSSLNALCKIPDTYFIIAGGENGSLLMYDRKTGKLSSNKELFGIDENIKDIHFTDKLTGYALLGYDKLIVTKDGGKSWKVGCININGSATALYFKAKTGFIFGNNYTILRLDVKTDKWILVNEAVSDKTQREHYIRDIYINNNGYGLAVGVKGMIISTNDYGMTWKPYDKIKTERDFVKISYADENIGYILCSKDVIFSTEDGGKSWKSNFNEDDQYKATYVEQQFYNMIFIDDKTGYLRANSGIRKTIDKGKSWANTELKNLPEHLILEDDEMFSIERHNIITSKNMGMIWESVNKEVMDGFIKVYYCSSNKIYGSVDNRRLLFSNNKGFSWEYKDVEKFLDIFYVDSLNAFMIYSDNIDKLAFNSGYGNEYEVKINFNIKCSTDGGKTWEKVDGNLNDITDNEIIYRFQNRWKSDGSLYFFNKEVGFIYNYGFIFRTRDGGKTWIKDDSKTFLANFTDSKKITNTKAMCFINEMTGFRTDENGGIYKTENGGEKWKLVFKSDLVLLNNDHYQFNYLTFTDEENGFAIGNFESICRTTDGGETWKLVRNTEYTYEYKKIYFSDKKTV
jgi:ankyrin repeat protein